MSGGNRTVPVEYARLQQTDPYQWTVADVGLWLQMNDFSDYRMAFIQNAISGQELVDLGTEDLVVLGVKVLGHRKKLLKCIQDLYGARSDTHSEVDADELSHDSSVSLGSQQSGTSKSSGASSSKARDVTFKMVHRKKVRIVNFPDHRKVSLRGLQKAAKDEFGKNMHFSFLDEDGDSMKIESDSDVRAVMKMGGDKVRLKCSTKNRGSKKSSIPDAEMNLLDTMLDAMVIIDKFGTILFFNSAAEKLWGWSRSELTDKNVKELMPMSYAAQHDKYLANYRRTGIKKVIGTSRNVIAMKKDGSTFRANLSLVETKDGRRHTFTGTVRVVKGEENSFLSSMEEAAISIDEKGTILFMNDAACKIWGYSADDVHGQNVKMLMPAPYCDNHDHYLANYFISGEKKVIGKTRHVLMEASDGTIKKVTLSVNEKVDDAGKKHFIGICTPADSGAAGKDKRSFLKRQRDIVNEMETAALIVNTEGTVQACNEVAQKMFGYDLSELLGQNVKKLAAEPHRSNHDQYLKNYLTTGVAKAIGKDRILPAQCKDGKEKKIRLCVTDKREGDDRLFIGVLHAANKF